MSRQDIAPRVLMVCERFEPIVGGLELQALALASQLATAGGAVSMITRRFRGLPRRETIQGVDVHRVLALNWMGPARVPFALGQIAFMLAAAWRLGRLATQFDLLHVHGLGVFAGPLAWLARRFGLPSMVTIATAQVGEAGLEGRRFAGLRRALNRQFDLFLAVSGEIEDELRSDGMAPDRIVRLPFFVNQAEFKPIDDAGRAAVRRQLWTGWPDEAVVIVALNRLEERKGMHVLVDAVARLGPELPWRLAIAGEGAERSRLERAIKESGLGDRIRLLGTVKDRPRLLNAADVFVLPSRYEGLPNGVLEALSSGVAVAVSRIPGITDIVDDRHAVMAPPDDADGWASALKRLIASPATRATLAAAGPELVGGRFGQTAILAQYDECCRRLLSRRGHA